MIGDKKLLFNQTDRQILKETAATTRQIAIDFLRTSQSERKKSYRVARIEEAVMILLAVILAITFCTAWSAGRHELAVIIFLWLLLDFLAFALNRILIGLLKSGIDFSNTALAELEE